MKPFSSLIGIVIAVSGVYAGVVEHVFYFDRFRVEAVKEGYSRIVCGGAVADGPVGDPGVPYYQVRLLLPPGEEATAWEIAGEDTLEVPGAVKLFPYQAQIPVSRKAATGAILRNEAVYASSSPYPSRIAGAVSTHYFNGYPVAIGVFTPVLYHPAKEKVFLLQKVRVTLRTGVRRLPRGDPELISADETGRRMLSSIVQNPEALKRYPPPRLMETPAKMLIVTKKEFKNGFDPLVRHHAGNGISCDFAFIEDIRIEESGYDEQEKIRNRILRAKKDANIGYVLLGGDTSIVKARFLKVNAGPVPGDIYYASLDGTWDKNGNKLWGEPGDSCDVLPDVSVGRLPFGTTIRDTGNMEAPVPAPGIQLRNMVSKIVLYQEKPLQGELNKPFLIGEMLDLETSSGKILNLLIGEKFDNGIATKGIPGSDNIKKAYLDDWIVDGYNIDSALKEGSSAIYHSGHGMPDEFLGLSFQRDFESRLKILNGIQKNFTFINTLACHSGAFHNPHSVGSKLLVSNNFIVALVGNSITGRYDPGTTDGASPRHQRLFVDALYNKNFMRIGDAHLYSKIAFSPVVDHPTKFDPEGNRVVFYCCNLLGDPAMVAWIRNNQLTGNHPLAGPAQPLPDGFRLSCMHAGPHVAIRFSMTKNDDIRLSLLDYKGRTVSLLARGTFGKGTYSTVFEKRNFACGAYMVELASSRSKEVAAVRIVK